MKNLNEPQAFDELADMTKPLMQAHVTFSAEHKARSRRNNLLALLAGWHFHLPYAQIVEHCCGAAPRTISPRSAPVIQIVKTYDYLVGIAQPWNMCGLPAALILKLAVRCDPARQEYGSPYERQLVEESSTVTKFPSSDSGGWYDILEPYFIWKRKLSHLLPYTGVGTLLYFLGKIYSIEPTLLPFCDYSAILYRLHNDIPSKHIVSELIRMLYTEVSQLHQHVRRQPLTEIDSKRLPMLKLLANGQALSAKELMEKLGIQQRLLFTNDWLNPTLAECLVVQTETASNSPKQKYVLSAQGVERLKLAQGIIA